MLQSRMPINDAAFKALIYSLLYVSVCMYAECFFYVCAGMKSHTCAGIKTFTRVAVRLAQGTTSSISELKTI